MSSSRVYNRTDKGKLVFLLIRDGSGFIQCVAFKSDLTPELFETISKLPQESSVGTTGSVRRISAHPASRNCKSFKPPITH
jgi:asparaginyl-tRNA synthetase